jgi:DNA-binding transcriptional regulator YdaS (Cro superfamily)
MRKKMNDEEKQRCKEILEKYIEVRGSQAKCARYFGLFPSAISLWLLRRQVPAYAAIEIAKELGIKKSLLRPDLYEDNE